MKKTQKKIIGLLGLVVVVAMTLFAAFLPGPRASAISSVTDTITVTVENKDQPPEASISSPSSGEKFLSPEQEIRIDYVNLKQYKLILTYTDLDGEHSPITVIENTDPGATGPAVYDLKTIIESFGLGYGNYVLELEAVGDNDSIINDVIEFDYSAIEAAVSSDSETGNTYINLDFNQNQEDLSDDLKIDHVILDVYDADGNIVASMSPIIVKPLSKSVEIVFPDGVPGGEYYIVARPYNAAGELLFDTVVMKITYDGKEIVVPATADTGGLFKNLNIAKTDYLVTGLGVFLVIGIGGIIYINNKDKKNKRRK